MMFRGIVILLLRLQALPYRLEGPDFVSWPAIIWQATTSGVRTDLHGNAILTPPVLSES
jgi:hypothetical protein